MNSFAVQIVVYLNMFFNFVGGYVLGFVAHMPGWLSNTIISVVAGVLFLLAFKYTSNQKAISRVKDKIKADLLAMKLYREFVSTTLGCQFCIFCHAVKLLVYSIRPMLVMFVPVLFLLAQMALWYQHGPVSTGEEFLVSAQLKDTFPVDSTEIDIGCNSSFEVIESVRVFSENKIYFKLLAKTDTSDSMEFFINRECFKKQLVISDDFVVISRMRPSKHFSDVLFNPAEKPFSEDSPIQSITIFYPQREGFAAGTDMWVIYFFIVSMVAAFIVKPLFKVKF